MLNSKKKEKGICHREAQFSCGQQNHERMGDGLTTVLNSCCQMPKRCYSFCPNRNEGVPWNIVGKTEPTHYFSFFIFLLF